MQDRETRARQTEATARFRDRLSAAFAEHGRTEDARKAKQHANAGHRLAAKIAAKS
jgi:hypothetical protein